MGTEAIASTRYIANPILFSSNVSRRISARAVTEAPRETLRATRRRASTLPPSTALLAQPTYGANEQQDAAILEHMPMVRYVARHLHKQLPEHIDTEDLVSAGVLGLMDACRNFNSDRNVRFHSYARFRVRGAMLDSLRAMDCASRPLRIKERAAKNAIRALTARLNRMPDEAEVAKELGLGLGDYQRLRNDLAQVNVLALEEVNRSSSDEQTVDDLPAQCAEDPSELCLRTELRETVTHALDALPDRERLVITLYYYEELSMAEIAKVLGVVTSRISQLHVSGLMRLRVALTALNASAPHPKAPIVARSPETPSTVTVQLADTGGR